MTDASREEMYQHLGVYGLVQLRDAIYIARRFI